MIEKARLARALYLTARRTASGRYTVTGGMAPHEVTVDGERLTCGCADASLRAGVECKHALAVLLRRGNLDVLAALRELVPMPKRRRPRAGTKTTESRRCRREGAGGRA